MEILEILPGVGQNIPLLSRYGAVDAVEEHLQGLSAIQRRSELRKVYPNSVPFTLNKNYDIICALDVLEHVEDDIGFI
jgi:2-polyprenyl-3-methyl-5-hydroxy-6-metoxy-1,4-benzoquinol methylase